MCVFVKIHFRFETMKVINQLCDFRQNSNISKLFFDVYANDSIHDTMIQFEPHMNETFVYCKLFDKWVNCSEIFFRTLSATGFCYSFNVIRLSEYLTDE